MPIDEAVKTQAPPRRFASAKDIEEFVSVLEAYERGVIGPDEFRTFRLTRGIYGQRQDDVQMIRVKIPQGILSGDQLRRLGRVAREHSRGFGHVTTRQNVQFHFVKMAAVPKAMEALEAVGLTTREACGNTVRNITACPMAGVCADEPFDVTPYGEALTRFFLRNPICQALPRKFKIALSGCPTDCAMGAMHDIGVIARTREVDGRREIGFKVVIGGGLSVSPQNAWVLHEFLPPDRLLPVCEAVVRVFDRTGNRKNRGQARMKYAIRKLGFETFKAEIDKELAALPPTRDPEIGSRSSEDERPPRPEAPDDLHERITRSGVPAFRAWAATNTRPQRQKGYSMAFVTLPRGDLTAGQMEALAALVGPRAVPAYQMFLGGAVDGEGAHFGRRSVKIPSRRVPEAVTRLLALFRDERRPDETALGFFKRVELERVNAALSDLASFAEADLREEDFSDLGSDQPFVVEMGEGECAT